MIPIYDLEINDGLEESIRASASFGILSEAVIAEPTPSQKEAFTKLVTADANPDQFDLYYLKSVLVSVGWNKNDDVFPYIDTWNARNTPVDKPFNYMHDMSDIIGHITSSIVVDHDGNIVDADTPLDDVPEVFDIVVGSVLYKQWPNEDAQSRMDSIIEEIPEGKWKVSMECLFRNFDYAIISPTGENKVVKRTEASAFLTKHLKRYGGSGEYEGYKVGRLLRSFTFSGKGLVDKPANPRSDVIGYSDKEETNVFVSATEAQVVDLQKEEKNNMSDIVTYTEQQYNFLKEELDGVKADIVNKDNEIADLQKQVAELKETNEGLEGKFQADNAGVVQDKDEQIADLSKKLEEAEASIQESNDKIAKIEADAARAARLASLLEKDVDEEKAESLLEKFAEASDEMFEELVSALPKKVEAEEVEEEEEENEEEASAENKEIAEEAIKEIEEVEVDPDQVTPANAGDESEDKLFQSTAGWIGVNLRSTAKLDK